MASYILKQEKTSLLKDVPMRHQMFSEKEHYVVQYYFYAMQHILCQVNLMNRLTRERHSHIYVTSFEFNCYFSHISETIFHIYVAWHTAYFPRWRKLAQFSSVQKTCLFVNPNLSFWFFLMSDSLPGHYHTKFFVYLLRHVSLSKRTILKILRTNRFCQGVVLHDQNKAMA